MTGCGLVRRPARRSGVRYALVRSAEFAPASGRDKSEARRFARLGKFRHISKQVGGQGDHVLGRAGWAGAGRRASCRRADRFRRRCCPATLPPCRPSRHEGCCGPGQNGWRQRARPRYRSMRAIGTAISPGLAISTVVNMEQGTSAFPLICPHGQGGPRRPMMFLSKVHTACEAGSARLNPGWKTRVHRSGGPIVSAVTEIGG